MKLKYLFLLFLILFSCNLYQDDIESQIEEIILNNLEIMQYKSDDPYTEYWETKEEIYKSLDGDCEEFVNKNIFDIYDQLGIKCNLAVLYTGHAILEYDNKLYECSNFRTKTLKHRYNYYNKIQTIILFNYINKEAILRRIK